MYISHAFTSLQVGLQSTLTRALIFKPNASADGFIGLQSELGGKLTELKNTPTKEALRNFEAWAINEAGQKLAPDVATAFNKFREDLQKTGVTFE